jgi:hypothetical protein
MPPAWSEKQWDKFVTAIQKVESGGEPNGGLGATSDNGKSLGPLMISEAAFQDAQEYDPSIKGKWEDCLNDLELSKKVCRAYIKRYAKDSDPVSAARVWNGGPSGPNKKSTEIYGVKFKRVY